MTEQELRTYRKLCREADDLQRRIQEEESRELPVVMGKVKGSMPEFPYIETRMSVEMTVPELAATSNHILKKYKAKLTEAEHKKLEIEQFIDKISDPELRLIFRYRFLDGMRLSDIGDKLAMDRSNVGKKVNNFLKLSHNSHFKVL